MPIHAFHGYAIISDDDMIADASGVLPEALKSEADWAYFQAELDLCQLVLLGRTSHEAAPNRAGRRRLVLSRSVNGLVERADAWWWNPADLPLADILARLLPEGGRIGVPGGQGAFDLVLAGPGYEAFHLTRAQGVRLPHGQPVFSACRSARAEDVLATRGYRGDAPHLLEPGVVLTLWRRT